jgi:CubicO group peptidase (beta-lactamase class C family)
MNRLEVATLLLAFLTATPATAETPQEAASRSLRETLAADHGPGMMAAAVRDGCVVWRDAAGYADLEQQVTLGHDTRMRIGSVSKTLTAALASRLIETGRMSADEDIRSYATGFPDKGRPITPRMLASHTAGIRHYDFGDYAEANNVRYYERLEDALAVFADDALLTPPGEAFEYSSFGYNLLGVAAAAAAEASFGEALATHVTGPLRLADTVLDHPLQVVVRRTRFYTVVDGGGVINTIWRDSSDYYPSGGLLSTATDLARFTHAVFAGDFLGDEGDRLVTTPARLASGEELPYTFGWQRQAVDGRLRYEHGGETNGAYAQVAYFPELDLALAGIANFNFWGETLGEPALFEWVLERLPVLLADAPCATDPDSR